MRRHLKKDRMVPYPPYTEGRPSTVVLSLMERAEKARVEGGDLVPLEPLESSRFHVEKSAGTITKMWEADTRDKHSRVTRGMDVAAYRARVPQSELCYTVDIKMGTCSCPDNTLNHTVCKHMFLVLHSETNEWTWQHLPDSLTRHPRMILDASVYGMKEALTSTAEQREQHFVREVGRAGGDMAPDLAADVEQDEDLSFALHISDMRAQPSAPHSESAHTTSQGQRPIPKREKDTCLDKLTATRTAVYEANTNSPEWQVLMAAILKLSLDPFNTARTLCSQPTQKSAAGASRRGGRLAGLLSPDFPIVPVITRATSSSIRTNTTSTTAPTTSHINVSVPAPPLSPLPTTAPITSPSHHMVLAPPLHLHLQPYVPSPSQQTHQPLPTTPTRHSPSLQIDARPALSTPRSSQHVSRKLQLSPTASPMEVTAALSADTSEGTTMSDVALALPLSTPLVASLITSEHSHHAAHSNTAILAVGSQGMVPAWLTKSPRVVALQTSSSAQLNPATPSHRSSKTAKVLLHTTSSTSNPALSQLPTHPTAGILRIIVPSPKRQTPSLSLTLAQAPAAPALSQAPAPTFHSNILKRKPQEATLLGVIPHKAGPGRPSLPAKPALPDIRALNTAATVAALAVLNAAVIAPEATTSSPQLAAVGERVTIVGSVVRTSPSTKPGYLNTEKYLNSTRRSVSHDRTGARANLKVHAISTTALTQHVSFCKSLQDTAPPAIAQLLLNEAIIDEMLLPGSRYHPFLRMCAPYASQGSRVWLAGRESVVTGSCMGSILGLDQPRAAKTLRATYYGIRSTREAFRQACGSPMQNDPGEQPADEWDELRMEYGSIHEVNGVLALLDQAGSVPCFGPTCALPMKFTETGLAYLDTATLERSKYPGVDFPGLPCVGSSADGALHWVNLAGEEVARTAVEVKTRGPFNRNTGQKMGHGVAFAVVSPVTRLSPSQIAQALLHMLVLGVGRCIVISQGVDKANVFVVYFDQEWCRLMLMQLQQVARLYIFPKVFPPLNFGDGLEGRAHFVAYTLQLCEGIKVHAQLNTVKGTDSVRFLAPLSSNQPV